MSQKKSAGKRLSASDESRIKNIFNTFSNLSDDAKSHVILRLPLAVSDYKSKRSWSPSEKNTLRLMWNRCNHDEICDAFACTYDSMLNQAKVLGLFPQDGIPLNGDDGANMTKLMDLGVSPKDVANKFELEYDFMESVPVKEEARADVSEMIQDNLFNRNA